MFNLCVCMCVSECDSIKCVYMCVCVCVCECDSVKCVS